MILNRKGEEIFAAHPTHPGELLTDELETRQMTQKQLANQTGVSATFI